MKKIIILFFIMFSVVAFSLSSFARKECKRKCCKKQDCIQKHDKNKDGKISLNEWLGKSKELFKIKDANGDGFLDKDEIKSLKKKCKKHCNK